MSKYRELVYLVLDEIKGISDDFNYTEDHIIYLLGAYRSFLLKQRYNDKRNPIPISSYQNICVNLEQYNSSNNNCFGQTYLKSVDKVPDTMNIGINRVYSIDYYDSNINLISKERMRYVGNNQYLKNQIYASIGPDNYLYLKSCNPQFLYLKKINISAIFEDPKEAFELQCSDENGGKVCDILDYEFPIEEALIPSLTQMIVAELLRTIQISEDNINNAHNDVNANVGYRTPQIQQNTNTEN
ncbi:MAG: hypothetical protein LBM96_05800 [Methanobrevibacter sp.]|jgi:hypothetical protein|nr:hypothetical protein [Candidatus Methanoflexus mossambicus]